MSAPDVLAVMDDDRKVLVAANRLSPIPLVISEHDEARAAVAELVEAAGAFFDGDNTWPDSAKLHQLRAALARVQGGADADFEARR